MIFTADRIAGQVGAQLPEDPPNWVAAYCGLPWGDVAVGGLDCYGLLRRVYGTRRGVWLPTRPGRYGSSRLAEGALAARDELWEGGDWCELSGGPSRPLDVGLFRLPDGRVHVGLAVARGRMLHSTEEAGSGVGRYDRRPWSDACIGWYRYAAEVELESSYAPMGRPGPGVVVPHGLTIAEIVQAAGISLVPELVVTIGGEEVPRELWSHVRPKPGRTVRVEITPRGGGGGLRLLLTIATVVAAIVIPGALGLTAGTLAFAAVGAAVSIGGLLLTNALAPISTPQFAQQQAGVASPTISGSRNSLRPFEVIPVVLGRHRVVPPLAARPYTEVNGDDQFLRQLFLFGFEGLDLTSFRIGPTDLSSFEGVELQTAQGPAVQTALSIYPGTVFEDTFNIELTQSASWQVRTSATEADELSVDVTFPQGLGRAVGTGLEDFTVEIAIEFSETGQANWRGLNTSIPSTTREMDFFFREPESTRLGIQQSDTSELPWSAGGEFGGPKPAYLPLSGYSYNYEARLQLDTITIPLFAAITGFFDDLPRYEFAVDGSDSVEVFFRDQLVASRYQEGPPAGSGGTPDFDAGAGGVLVRSITGGVAGTVSPTGDLRVRLYSRSPHGGAVAVAWRRVEPDGTPITAWETIPSGRMSSAPGLFFTGLRNTSWYSIPGSSSIVATANAQGQIRRSVSWGVPRGQYDVRLRRVTADTAATDVLDDSFWTALRTIRNTPSIRRDDVAAAALRIRATDQLNGVVDQLSAIAESICPDWDSASQQWVERPTNNPASLFRYVLTHPGNQRPLDPDRIDLSSLEAWHDHCEAEGFECDAVLDFRGTLWERLIDICAAGRASPTLIDGVYGVVVDKRRAAQGERPVPVQHFTPRNIQSFSGRIEFAERPHALRARFLNRDADWQQDERIVVDDGFQLNGIDGHGQADTTSPEATVIETLDLFGCTSPDMVWKHCRYRLAEMRLRAERFELRVGAEHLECTRGDPVVVTHDVPRFGLASGRLAAVNVDAHGRITTLVVDQLCEMMSGRTYVVRIRERGGTSRLYTLATLPGTRDTLILATPIPPNDTAISEGDLFMFGEQGSESIDAIVTNIAYDQDLVATLTLAPYVDAVYDADQGAIPAFTSSVTSPPDSGNAPVAPVIESVRSDRSVMIVNPDGTLTPRILIALRQPSGSGPYPSEYELRYRKLPATPGAVPPQFTVLPPTTIVPEISIDPVEVGATYEIRVRSRTSDGLFSSFTDSTHTVSGNTQAPAPVTSFDVARLSDGTRRFTFAYADLPDLAGVLIRYGEGGLGLTWDDLQPLNTNPVAASPITSAEPPAAGSWTFGIKVVDTSGNQSDATLIDRTLGEPPGSGLLFQHNGRATSWSGTITGGSVTGSNTLEGSGTSMAYQTPSLDVGAVLEIVPDLYLDAPIGEATVEISTSDDDVTYTAWSAFVALTPVTARYVRWRITLAGDGVITLTLRQLIASARVNGRAETLAGVDSSALTGANRIAVGDVRLPITESFGRIDSVMLTFTGGGGFTYELVDTDTAVGPRVRIYDNTTTLADTTFNAEVRGF